MGDSIINGTTPSDGAPEAGAPDESLTVGQHSTSATEAAPSFVSCRGECGHRWCGVSSSRREFISSRVWRIDEFPELEIQDEPRPLGHSTGPAIMIAGPPLEIDSLIRLDQRPVALPVKPENLPDALMECNQWVVWSYVWTEGKDGKPGKWDKPPVDAKDNTAGSSTNRKTWASFAEAVQAREWRHHDGIGFAVAHDDPFYVVDFDHCFTDGELLPMARAIVDRTRSHLYWERSPSGAGLRGVGIGTLPKHGRKNAATGFEIYSTGRYVTMTGHTFEGCDRIGDDSTVIIAELHREQFGDAPQERTRAHQNGVPPADDLDIVASLQGMANGAKFARLMQGSTADYGSDDSSADAALIERLLWRNGGDIEQAVRIACTSGLWREKWETRRGSSNYIRYTAERILAKMTDFYNPYHGRPMRTWVGTLPGGEPARFVAVKVRG